ncbi:hypothetical protein JHK86_009217 [Glycine max]|nr:hypothetical protein JHK86_009217 [Glycine max]
MEEVVQCDVEEMNRMVVGRMMVEVAVLLLTKTTPRPIPSTNQVSTPRPQLPVASPSSLPPRSLTSDSPLIGAQISDPSLHIASRQPSLHPSQDLVESRPVRSSTHSNPLQISSMFVPDLLGSEI